MVGSATPLKMVRVAHNRARGNPEGHFLNTRQTRLCPGFNLGHDKGYISAAWGGRSKLRAAERRILGVHNGASPLSSHSFLMCSPNWLGDELGELLLLIAGIIASAWGVSWEQGLLAVDAAAS